MTVERRSLDILSKRTWLNRTRKRDIAQMTTIIPIRWRTVVPAVIILIKKIKKVRRVDSKENQTILSLRIWLLSKKTFSKQFQIQRLAMEIDTKKGIHLCNKMRKQIEILHQLGKER